MTKYSTIYARVCVGTLAPECRLAENLHRVGGTYCYWQPSKTFGDR